MIKCDELAVEHDMLLISVDNHGTTDSKHSIEFQISVNPWLSLSKHQY